MGKLGPGGVRGQAFSGFCEVGRGCRRMRLGAGGDTGYCSGEADGRQPDGGPSRSCQGQTGSCQGQTEKIETRDIRLHFDVPISGLKPTLALLHYPLLKRHIS